MSEIATYVNTRISAVNLTADSYIGVENLLPNIGGRINSSYVPTSGSSIGYVANDILIGNIRPYLQKIWMADSKGGTNQDVLVVRVKEDALPSLKPRFLYHLLASDNFFTYNMQHARGAKMPRGDKTAILQYEIAVPPIGEQARIVNILDKFDALTNSITEGLPREIELRQTQYEHYRDLLLSFPKSEEVAA